MSIVIVINQEDIDRSMKSSVFQKLRVTVSIQGWTFCKTA